MVKPITDGVDPRVSAARRILVIEDNPDSRETLRSLLQLLGHYVEVAEDGVRGVERALAGHPDVAIIDIGLPKLDGYQVARRLRAALGRGIVLIAHTGYGQPEAYRQGQEAGFDVYLVKPVDWPELVRELTASAGRIPSGQVT
jgi:CheY-like chemotaxis protein